MSLDEQTYLRVNLWWGFCYFLHCFKPALLPLSCDLSHRSFTINSIGRTERSALKVLREQLFAHKSDLVSAFKQFDSKNTGVCRGHLQSRPRKIRWCLIYSLLACSTDIWAFVFVFWTKVFNPTIYEKTWLSSVKSEDVVSTSARSRVFERLGLCPGERDAPGFALAHVELPAVHRQVQRRHDQLPQVVQRARHQRSQHRRKDAGHTHTHRHAHTVSL